MNRNWGLGGGWSRKSDRGNDRLLLTIAVALAYGALAAVLAAASFTSAKAEIPGLFHGASLIFAVLFASAGCWGYVICTQRRFHAAFGQSAPFRRVLAFFLRGAVYLAVSFLLALGAGMAGPDLMAGMMLCFAGGVGAAAAFQTVLAFTPRPTTHAA